MPCTGCHAEAHVDLLLQLYEDLYWQNYDTMESNRIELAKQAKREALQAAEAANREEDLEMPIELQQGSGFFPGLGAKVRILLFDSLMWMLTQLQAFGGCGAIWLVFPSFNQQHAVYSRHVQAHVIHELPHDLWALSVLLQLKDCSWICSCTL